MLTINKEKNGNDLVISPKGHLDTLSSPELEAELKSSMPDAESLVMDLSGLEYISSAGLRVLLSAQKVMSKKGGMKVINCNEVVKEVFEVTGFVDVLDIE